MKISLESNIKGTDRAKEPRAKRDRAVPNIHKLNFIIMKATKIILLLAILFLATEATAQSATYRIQGNEIVSTQAKATTAKPVKTNLTHTVSGNKYPVYISAKGKYFIIRTSKKTGKDYKQYLKITK